MKKLYFILTIILLAVTNITQAQNDSIYFWKSGAMIHRQSIKTVDLDSITFTAPDVNPNPSTIYAVLNGNPNLSLFVDAIDVTGLSSPLNGIGPFTVFAPTNQAFNNFLLANGFGNIEAVPIPVLRQIVLNHCMSGNFQSTAFTTGYVKTLATGAASITNSLSMYWNFSNSALRINGISDVITADLEASNGIIHVVNSVITLPTITNHLVANPNFSTLVSLLARPGQPDFASVLSGTDSSPFTVFAPFNSAFTALDAELAPGGIAGVSANNITSILQYHVVAAANVLSITLTDGQVINSISGQTFQFSFTGGPRIRDAQNRLSSIILTDIQCSNGVIHALDRVLLPTF
jgi:uncharacterized surface protein with fasciclin (FAS1) repeats